MSFKEFIIKSGLTEGCAKTYKNLLDNVCADMNITLKTISLGNIDDIIESSDKENAYMREGHGNSYVSALRKYKEYLLYKNNKTILANTTNKPKLPQTGTGD